MRLHGMRVETLYVDKIGARKPDSEFLIDQNIVLPFVSLTVSQYFKTWFLNFK